MNPGKVSNQILKRSVMKYVRKRREDVVVGASIGQDCAIVNNGSGYTYLTANPVICGPKYCEYAVYRGINNIYAAGGVPTGIMVNVTFGKTFDEALLRNIMERLDKCCERYGMQILGGHTCASDSVNTVMIDITSVGYSEQLLIKRPYKTVAGSDIVVTKDIAMAGANIMSDVCRDKILSRYSKEFYESQTYVDGLTVAKEAQIALRYGVSYMHDVSEGGIFCALWDLSEACKAGITIDMKKIPIKQSTVEVCELFELNPYYMYSVGSLLIVAEDGKGLVKELNDNGIKATVIGKITETKDKLLISGEERRYLNIPQRDEIYQIF